MKIRTLLTPHAVRAIPSQLDAAAAAARANAAARRWVALAQSVLPLLVVALCLFAQS